MYVKWWRKIMHDWMVDFTEFSFMIEREDITVSYSD